MVAPTRGSRGADVETESSLSVLVVDADSHTRRLVVRVLTDAGYSASGVASVGDALALMLLNRFHACVIDLDLPGIPGLDLVGHISMHRHDIAMIVLTGVHDVKRARGAHILGVDNYLTKPIRPHQIVGGVSEALVTRALKVAVRAR